MDIYPRYKSELGYELNDDKTDTYGVNHQKFSLKDAMLYEQARLNREDQYKQCFNEMGITKNYPQYGTNFWGTSPQNNYGFGDSKIDEATKMMSCLPIEMQLDEESTQPRSQNDFSNVKRGLMTDVISDGLKGFGMGIEGALLFALNSMTKGWLDEMSNDHFGGIYQKKQQDLDNLIYSSDNPGIKKAYQYSKLLIDKASRNMPITKLLGEANKNLRLKNIK